MNILFYGVCGTMGRTFVSCATDIADIDLICGVDKYIKNPENYSFPIYSDCSQITENVDCIIDFSVHTSIYDYLPYAVKNNIPCVIATTGFTQEELSYIEEQSKTIPILKSGNMSLGINTLLQLSKICSKILGDKADIEIVEQHHNKKLDSPSGTALLLADGIKEELQDHTYILGRSGMQKRTPTEIGINSIRGGTIVGKHEVMFIMNNEIITLKHEAESKSVFAYGSMNAARYIVKQKPGLYSMENLFQN